MNRETAKELLVDYFNGHLASEEREQIRELLLEDAEFKREADDIEREMSLFRTSMDDPYEDARLTGISEGVKKRIRDKHGKTLGYLSPSWRSYIRAAAAVVLILVGFVIFFSLKPGSRQETAESLATESEQRTVSPDQTSEETTQVGSPDEQENKPRIIRLSIATSNPKVKINWTLSENFEL